MRKIHPFPLLFLASIATAAAQEPNPFVRKAEVKAPATPAGAATVQILEACSLPSRLLDSWLEANPPGNDATALRTQLQIWFTEKKATLEHTAVVSGTEGRDSSVDSTYEQVYPTEFMPAKVNGTWPLPTAFETRNCGYNFASGTAPGAGASPPFRVRFEFVALQWPQECPFPVAEASREPGDIFVPKFWSFRSSQADPTRLAGTYYNSDPFAPAPVETPENQPRLTLAPSRIHLAGRADAPAAPGAEPPDRLSRLIFVRAASAKGDAAASTEIVPEHYQVSLKIVKTPHLEFSEWLQKVEPTTLTLDAWPSFARDRIDSGAATILDELTANGRVDTLTAVNSYLENIYPTEYMAQPDDVSFPTAYETRNAGSMLEASLVADSRGLLLQSKLQRIRKAGESVHRRTHKDGKWVPDMTYPIFTGYSLVAPLRVKKGAWMLAGTASDFSAEGKQNPDHCVMLFVKVE